MPQYTCHVLECGCVTSVKAKSFAGAAVKCAKIHLDEHSNDILMSINVSNRFGMKRSFTARPIRKIILEEITEKS